MDFLYNMVMCIPFIFFLHVDAVKSKKRTEDAANAPPVTSLADLLTASLCEGNQTIDQKIEDHPDGISFPLHFFFFLFLFFSPGGILCLAEHTNYLRRRGIMKRRERGKAKVAMKRQKCFTVSKRKKKKKR
eukprot:TRINITY_DN14439_c0_g1_i2.p1 TRINITY_DN14439_c0_g1~~TRINITY_DN14439_c0_g1_i2.p1  ORF type:complete len:131 (-),score=6.65 TRINITY_DN14439_c0_g1_i2:80-472(-)